MKCTWMNLIIRRIPKGGGGPRGGGSLIFPKVS